MPSCINSVPSSIREKMHLIDLNTVLSTSEIHDLEEAAKLLDWNDNIPGGFIHNTPQRRVNSFGDGSGYDNMLASVGSKWTDGYWTLAVHQSDVTMRTPLQELPCWLKKLGIQCRKFAEDNYNITTTDHTFNLAVCNYYTDNNHEIAAHTDDNEWYVRDLPEGPMFASLTLYPHGKPKAVCEHANFQIYVNDVWENVTLPHASILLMPSCIPHRVRKMKTSTFFPRINITLRSVPSIEKNPLYSMQGTSNHARYYRKPVEIMIPSDKNTAGHVDDAIKAFSVQNPIVVTRLNTTKQERSKERKALRLSIQKRNYGKIQGNTVTECLREIARLLD